MKIVLLHYAAPPVVGGVESVIGQHARLFAQHGHAVQILAGRGSQVDDHIPFIALPQVDSRHPDVLAVKSALDSGQIPDEFYTLRAMLIDRLRDRLNSVDYIVAHNVCSLAKNLALTAALKILSEELGSPHLILWHHDLAWLAERYQAELHPGYPWDLLRTDWPGATQVVVSRQRQAELAGLLDISAERIHIVPNGLDAARFYKLGQRTRQLCDQLKLLDACPLLLLPVRLTTRKNIELALRVLSALRNRLPRSALLVTGPLGPHNPANLGYFQDLLALRAELGLDSAAHFLAELSDEYLPDEVIADFYRLADALFMPSREEGFGIPILEAALAGLPIFCTAIPPLQELGGVEATYFSPDGEPAAIAEQVANRLQNDATYRLRTRARQYYSWEHIYTQKIAPLFKPAGP